MTLHETRSTNTTRNKSSEQNDLKKLKSKYSQKLPTLKVLFSDWSDDDLLFVLEEANGDLDLTIDRISEGHANQWGEVKTKKSKKEAQKAKAATTVVSSHQLQSTTTPITNTIPSSSSYSRDNKITQQQRSYNNDRVTRPGKAPVSSSSSRTRTAKIAQSWDNAPKSNHHEASSGSWASIASSKQDDSVFQNEEAWNTTTNDQNTTSNHHDEWSTPSTNTAHTTHTHEEESNDDQPKTWASLLKSKPKPEAELVQEETTAINNNNETNTSEWDTPATNEWNTSAPATTDSWNAPNEPVIDEWSTPAHESTPVEINTSVPIVSEHTEVETHTSNTLEEQPSFNTTEEKEEKPVISSRLLNQEEPVVLPSSTSNMSALDVKFGSLNVEEEPTVNEEKSIKEPESSVADIEPSAPVAQPVAAAAATTSTVPTTSTAAPETVAPTTDAFSQSSAYLKNETAYQQPQLQQHQQAIPQQQQQQPTQQLPQQGQIPQQIPQQHNQFGMDHLTSAYSSYLPNQPPTGVSGFGMNPMGGNLPDYGIYGTEAQRAAAMGYYDPTAFSHSPSVTSASTYPTRDKYSEHGQSQNTMPQQQQQQQQQQMYPTNLPYYQYYYMPNQFNYGQSAYGQPFMNKSMYPNMYGQAQPGKPTSSPYGANANVGAAGAGTHSPYGQQSQLYGNTASNGYDDLNMGLNDYQKSMYGGGNTSTTSQPQLGGFLGHLNGNGQPQQQTPTQQPTQSKTGATTTASATTTPPAQQQQQHQPQQQQQQQQQQSHQPYGANYFGQPQMFSYGQQYPQQSQQGQFQQHMAQQQQPSRQQQYWNQ